MKVIGVMALFSHLFTMTNYYFKLTFRKTSNLIRLRVDGFNFRDGFSSFISGFGHIVIHFFFREDLIFLLPIVVYE
jgi:hypothetical protein